MHELSYSQKYIEEIFKIKNRLRNLVLIQQIFNTINYYSGRYNMKKIFLKDISRDKTSNFNNDLETGIVNNEVKKILCENINIKMEDLQKKITPIISDCDIFISYSHKDEDLAKNVASSLISLGKKVFLDNLYWGSIDEALKIYDEKNCKLGKDNYSYSKRNKSTAIFHMILIDSIYKTIKTCKTFIFIENKDIFNKDNKLYETYSPWIYFEIETANQIAPNYKQLVEKYSFENKVTFPIDLKNFVEVKSLESLIDIIRQDDY